MNFHSSTIKKYYPALVGAALIAASLFQFSRPVLSAGTEAGQKIRNTATGTYEDDAGNDYTIDSNTVEVTVAKVAGITNYPTGVTDNTTGATNTSVLTGDDISFEFTITNVGNDVSNIFIPDKDNIATKGLDPATMVVEVSEDNGANFTAYPANGIVEDVPINGKIIVKVTAKVTATAAGAPIEVRLGDTGPNTDINDPVLATQNQFDNGTNLDVAQADNEVRTLNATTLSSPANTLDPNQQKEASAVQQISLGSNPLAMTKIEKTREYDETSTVNTNTDLDDNIITYNLDLEVLATTPNVLYTPGKLEGRDFTGRMPASITDVTNLVLVSDAIPDNTSLDVAPVAFTDADGREWKPVYATTNPAYVAGTNVAADQIVWGDAPADLKDVTRVGWVYDANSTPGAIEPGTVIPGFTFDVVTDGFTGTNASGGTVANIAQVFGSTDDGVATTNVGEKIFDESGDQNPSNFSGVNPGPSETATGSTGIANPAGHGVDSDNNNNATGSDPDSPGGEDNVITIGAPGDLLNGPDGEPAATGDIFITTPNNNHDFQNKGIDNFASTSCTPAIDSGNPQSGKGCTLNPNAVVFDNTLSNPGANNLTNVLLQPINPSFDGFGGTDADLPAGTKVTIKLGTQQAIYTYTLTSGNYSFVLDANTTANPSQPIKIPTLAAGVPLDYKVTIDLPAGTKLSTDEEHGYAVPIIAFVDSDNDGTPDNGENSNYTVNQVYTDFVKIEKQVKVIRDGQDVSGMGYADPDTDKKPLPGDTLVYRVNYRNISEPQAGNGGNLVLNGIGVMIHENGTQAGITGMETTGNNWGMDNNGDDDLDTINVQNTATDSSSNSEITYWTGKSPAVPAVPNPKSSVESLTAAGTTDPGETVTGYRVEIPLLAPAESATDNSTFIFQRKVDQYDGLAQEGLD
jgi:hypothetical protein